MKAFLTFALFVTTLSAYSAPCEMDYDTRTDEVDGEYYDWEFFGPTALQQGKSIEQTSESTFDVVLHSGEYWDESTNTYVCEDKDGYKLCIFDEHSFDAIAVVKKGKNFVVYDATAVGGKSGLSLNKKISAVFVCN